MKGPTFKKTKEPPTRANRKGDIEFPNALMLPRSISNNERGGLKP